MSGVLIPTSAPPSSACEQLVMPDFVRPVTALEARLQRWQHQFVSCLSIPFLALGRCAPRNSFGILMYHRVCPMPQGRFRPTYHVTPEAFRRHLSWLLEHGYRPYTLARLMEMRARGEAIPPRSFAVTFDDGFANNATHALPVLQELNIPATVFLATAYVGSDRPFPFDSWITGARSIEPFRDCWRPLTCDECEVLLESGLVELGCHTHTHADFRGRPDALASDVEQSLDFLKHRLGVENPSFSYPFGVPQLGFADPILADVVRRAGCSFALQIGNSLVDDATDPFHLGRFDVPSTGSGRSLAGKLDGWSQVLRSVWRLMRKPRA